MDLVALSTQVEERYRRYLKTTFYFRDPDLRASFEEALNSGQLRKGPYLEATPVFKRGQTPRALFQRLTGFQPDEGFLKALQADRPLYQHQEEAIRKVHDGRNVVVATGTGSGKTEAFLYPALIHLFQEFQAGELCPGVRSLILYPMNALANDQRDRLGEICKWLEEGNSPFRFTYGQYIGATPEDANDSHRQAHAHMANKLPGEVVFRSEMRQRPPHILLTNYSMLEYLLLRPDDSPLFDNGRAQWWTFLVLDEAHQYRGSRGIEMAMLVRRLKQRLREGGRSQPFRCIATSATLGGGEGDRAGIAKFASDLFGEEFSEGDVILGETESVPEPGADSLPPNVYRLLRDVLKETNIEARSLLDTLVNNFGMPRSGNEDLMTTVYRILQRDNRVTKLNRLITGRAAEVWEIASQVFDDLPGKNQVSALSELVELLVQVHDPGPGAPLLSARYHLFLRSLEGAFVSYWPQKKVFLERKTLDEAYTAFEVALCRECGQHYFVGPKDFKGKLREAIRDPSHPDFGATFFRPIENGEDRTEEDGSSESNEEEFRLCTVCGEIARDRLTCAHNHSIQVVKEHAPNDEDRADQLAKCGVCGYNAAGRDPVRELVHGTDGPNAVIATTLIQSLPDKRKKVLAFADSRQEAAFFAWYLEDSYKDILSRNLILKIAKSFPQFPPDGISLRTIADKAFHDFHDAFKRRESDDEPTVRKNIWCALYNEFLTDEQRISLEGVGLVRWSITWPDWFRISNSLVDLALPLTEEDRWNLACFLLDTLRTDKAVEFRHEENVSLNWSDLSVQGLQARVVMNERGRLRKGEKRWSGKTGKRARFLVKLCMRKGLSEQEAVEKTANVLRSVWDTLRQGDENASSSRDRLLIPVEDARRLNPDWWRLHLIKDDDAVFQCGTCGRLQTSSISMICLRHRCPGTVTGIRQGDLEHNHYRILYEEDLSHSLRVEEHTAQLDKDRAREFQREFREGRIHVLSCSTTFELGVDLGNLDTIFLRNVPPEAFNYAQRVGRAGRRRGYPGFAITYCRRAPHDLYHFSDPQHMLGGTVRPPVLSLRNAKIIIRHVVAMALSRFFRRFPERFRSTEERTSHVQRLFKDLENPMGACDFEVFLHQERTEIEESLRAIVPAKPDMAAEVGLNDGSWIEKIVGDKSRFSLAEAEIKDEYRQVKNLEATASQSGDYDKAKRAKARAKTIAEEDVPSFLSRKAVIPKYGFPVDVVELDTQRFQQNQVTMDVSLQRDLAIAVAEFAPTSKVIANKREWTSYGLKRVTGKEWDRWWYGRCTRHNQFVRGKFEENVTSHRCCEQMKTMEYIDPQFGFVTSWENPKEPKGRSARVFSTRPYFAGFKERGDEITLGRVTLTRVSPGYLVVLCEGRRGQGFYICGQCGAGFRKREATHETPYGQTCHGMLEQVSLGHEFVTDVLQLRFPPSSPAGVEPVSFAYSLAYALVEGASEVLEVPSNDLSATVAHGGQYPVPPIILYDNVPGGAGLVTRLEEEEIFSACLEAAKKRVSGNCCCAEGTSCYGCLRSYRNQFCHQHLQRGPVLHYLGALPAN